MRRQQLNTINALLVCLPGEYLQSLICRLLKVVWTSSPVPALLQELLDAGMITHAGKGADRICWPLLPMATMWHAEVSRAAQQSCWQTLVTARSHLCTRCSQELFKAFKLQADTGMASLAIVPLVGGSSRGPSVRCCMC